MVPSEVVPSEVVPSEVDAVGSVEVDVGPLEAVAVGSVVLAVVASEEALPAVTVELDAVSVPWVAWPPPLDVAVAWEAWPVEPWLVALSSPVQEGRTRTRARARALG